MIIRPLRPPMLGRVTLCCDGPTCEPRRRFVSRWRRARKARADAVAYGWEHRNGRDHCEGCAGVIYVPSRRLADTLQQVERIRAYFGEAS